MTSYISMKDVGVTLSKKRIVSGISAEFNPGTITVLVGPNGSGKSTLLSALVGSNPFEGTITVGGRALKDYPRKERVEKLALVAQNDRIETDLTVRQIVELGVLVRHGAFGSMTEGESTEVERAISHADLGGFENRTWNSLSGGEQQRTQLARAMAQQADAIVLDEPTNHLDIHHRMRLMRQLQHQAYNHNVCVIVAIHDLDLAARFGDQMIVLRGGKMITHGRPDDALTPEVLRDVFGIQARLHHSGETVSLEVDEAVDDWKRRD